MKFLALKELPQGQRPGEEFEASEAMGAVLELVGAARRVEAVEPVADPPRKQLRTYRRRDLAAEP